MDTTVVDRLVTTDVQSALIVTCPIPVEENFNRSDQLDESILDLSQRPTTKRKSERKVSSSISLIIDNWNETSSIPLNDQIDDEEWKRTSFNAQEEISFNVEQSLTDQLKNPSIDKDSMSDNSNKNRSKLDFYSSAKKLNRGVIHRLVPCLNSSPYSSTNFLWSRYFSVIGERPVSDEFFDHYLASVQSSLEIDMKFEYCYDLQEDFHWIVQIQLVSHRLIRLHYVGLTEDQTTNDFWADFYDQRCHPIGWCQENRKLLIPPTIVAVKTENENSEESLQPVPNYLFDQNVGLTPVDQLHVGMIFELQDIRRPWTLWFVRIVKNRGGRLHLRYVTTVNDEEQSQRKDLHLFYLDSRLHRIGWSSTNSSIYFYEIPPDLTIDSAKQSIIEFCLSQSAQDFYPPNLFKEQEKMIKHRFTEGMKLEVFHSSTQQIYVGQIGQIHNEFYFDVLIANNDENDLSLAFVGHATHPHILPAHWAAEHKLTLMKGKDHRQSNDYWNDYSEKFGLTDLAPERCFNLITLNAAGSHRVEPGMKMEMISTINNEDFVFSVTLIHVADHLMWLRVDNRSLFQDEKDFYQIVPINSLDVFPVGWAKHNQFQLILPIDYQINIENYQEDRSKLFSSVTKFPRIPRVYQGEIDLLTIYVNIRCFSGPNLCSSRLARIPSQFGPGPFRLVLIDLFHHLLSATSTNSHRALRRLDHQIHAEKNAQMKTEQIKAAKKTSKLIRPITIPTDPRLVVRFLRHVCTQLEACPNLISIEHFDQSCPEKCFRLSNRFTFSTHSKHKRTGPAQLRAALNRQRKQKSLLGHLKNLPTSSSSMSSPTVEELPLLTESTEEISSTVTSSNENSQTNSSNVGTDRQTRRLCLHFEARTHKITRNNKQQKSSNITHQETEQILTEIKEESLDQLNSDLSPKDSKRSRQAKKKRSLSPDLLPSTIPVTQNILSPSIKTKKKRRLPSPILSIAKVEVDPNYSPVRSTTSYSIPPPIDPRNPVTWNVNDVCWYLNESGCSFALKTIKEQEIDGAALLLLDDLNTVQDLLEFKLGPAVKFFHVVEQLRSRVIDTVHSSPSLRSSSRLSTGSSSSSSATTS